MFPRALTQIAVRAVAPRAAQRIGRVTVQAQQCMPQFNRKCFHNSAFCACDAAIPAPSGGDDKEYSPKIVEIVDEIASLNLLEVADLVTLLKDKLNISDAQLAPAAMAMPAGGAAPGAAAAADEPVAEQTEFDVKLTGFDAKAKIKVIKEVRAITGLGLKESKELVEGAPKVIKKELKKDEAEALKEKLAGVGAVVELE